MNRFYLMLTHPKTQPMIRLNQPNLWGGLNAVSPRKIFTNEEVSDEISRLVQCKDQLGLYRYVKVQVT